MTSLMLILQSIEERIWLMLQSLAERMPHMMFVTLMVVGFFALLFIIIYAPAIYWMVRARYSKRRFEEALTKLGALFEKCRIVITERLGEGPFEESGITFEQAQQNQHFAVESVLKLLNWFSKLCPTWGIALGGTWFKKIIWIINCRGTVRPKLLYKYDKLYIECIEE